MDPDVAAMIGRLRKERNQSLKQLINDALRQGLTASRKRPKKTPKFVENPVDLGKCRFENLDNIQEILSIVEGDWRK